MPGGSCAPVSLGSLGMSSQGSPEVWMLLWSVTPRSVVGRPCSSSRVSAGGGLWGARGCVAVPHHTSHAAPYEPCCAIQAVPLLCAGDKVFSFDLELRVTKERPWLDAGPCDAALRWLERYYCLQGTQFYRFRPHSWEVLPGYPRDLRDYFIPCPGRGEAPLGLSQASAAF